LDDNPKDEMVSYLLGELTGEKAEVFEQRYLADQDTFELLETVEEELIEDYLRGALSPAERVLFERRYMSRPENQEKIDFARHLLESLSDKLEPVPSPEPSPRESESTWHRLQPVRSPEPEPREEDSKLQPVQSEPSTPEPESTLHRLKPVPPRAQSSSSSARYVFYSVAAALVFGIAVAICLLAISRMNARLAAADRQQARLEREAEELRARLEAEQGNNKALADQLQSVQDQLKELQQRGTSGSVLSLILQPLMTRGATESGPQIPLKPGVTELDLKLDVSRFDYQSYQPTIRRLSGATIPAPGTLRRSGKYVSIKLPAQVLKPGIYRITLNGISPDGLPAYAGEYSFTLTR
jgi:hypothetical protein